MTGAVLLTPPEKRWACPACTTTAVTRESRPHTEMHQCAGLGGLTAPMVEVHGTELPRYAARHVLLDREDYVGPDIVRMHEGRAVMALVTEHDDGHTDCTVYAPTAVAAGQI